MGRCQRGVEAMSTIAQLRLWKDVGFTEGCMEVPSTSTLTNPDLQFTDLNPTKARMFNEIRVPEDYVTLLEFSYLAITVDNSNGPDKTFYGWIDSVELYSDSQNAPMTVINWHVDLWRTYFAQAEFGSGTVKRRPVGTDQPPQRPPYRYLRPTERRTIDQDDTWWAIITLNEQYQSGGGTNTRISVRVVPLTPSAWDTAPYIGPSASPVYALPIESMMNGDWDELWGVDPQNILSVFVSPIPPCVYSGSGTQSSPFNLPTSKGWEVQSVSGVNAWFQCTYGGGPSDYMFEEQMFTFSEIMTDDTIQYHVRGFDGETLGILPWGVPVTQVHERIVYSVSGCYLQLRFTDATANDYTLAHQYGLVYTMPLLSMDVTENSWSSYVFSGQRQYDMEQRKLASDTKAVNGGIDIATGALTGAMTGAMAGSVVPGIGTVVGAVVGAIGGTLATAISTGATYAYETGYANDEMQRMEDYAHSLQADGLLLPGIGVDSLFHGTKPDLVKVEMDAYSVANFTSSKNLYGVVVDEPRADCTALIGAKGPIRIEGLIVKGDIPPVAKRYIKDRIAKGVIIK